MRKLLETLEDRRLMSAGDLDTTFGTAGKLASAQLGFVPRDIAVQADGKIVAVGQLNKDFAVARLNANGTKDTSFGGGDGLVTTDFGGNKGDYPNAVAIGRGGKIIVVGHRDNFSDALFGDQGQFAVARYNRDGSPDSSFAGDGKRTIDFSGWYGDEAFAVYAAADGGMLIAGKAGTGHASPDNDFAIARLTDRGALSNTLDGDGLLTTHAGGGDYATAITMDTHGKIIVAGHSSGISQFAVLRYNSDGSLDQTFAGDGTAFNSFTGAVRVNDLSVGLDRRITVVGEANGNFAMARFTANGKADTSFGAGTGKLTTDFGTQQDRALSIRPMARGQMLVSGYSHGQFAMSLYSANGALDGSFGQGGKVITTFGADEACFATGLTEDGKILAYSRNTAGQVLVGRYMGVAPRVELVVDDATTNENGLDRATLRVTRDAVYEYRTRVYLVSAGGNAAFGKDYSSGLTLVQRSNGGALARGFDGGDTTPPKLTYVDIPAGQSSVSVPINAINDRVVEGAEYATFTLNTNPFYTAGNKITDRVNVLDDDNIIL